MIKNDNLSADKKNSIRTNELKIEINDLADSIFKKISKSLPIKYSKCTIILTKIFRISCLSISTGYVFYIEILVKIDFYLSDNLFDFYKSEYKFKYFWIIDIYCNVLICFIEFFSKICTKS